MTPVMNARRAAMSLVVLTMLSGCQVVPQNGSSPAPAPTPAPASPPVSAPSPAPAAPAAPAPVAAPSNLNWEVAPVVAGAWTYRAEGAERQASFGPAGAQPLFAVACLSSSRQIAVRLPRSSGASRALTIRTTYGALQWSAASGQGSSAALSATRPASDPGLDWIAYSRGRIAVQLEGQPPLIVPSGSEIGRVVEDCRS